MEGWGEAPNRLIDKGRDAERCEVRVSGRRLLRHELLQLHAKVGVTVVRVRGEMESAGRAEGESK